MQDLKQLKQIKSPCVSICKYNKNNYCVGCKRYMSEIFDWFDYSDEMRESIMSDLDNRDIDNPD